MLDLGKYLRSKRDSSGLTAVQVAERLSASQSYVSKLERDQIERPESEKVSDYLASVLDAEDAQQRMATIEKAIALDQIIQEEKFDPRDGYQELLAVTQDVLSVSLYREPPLWPNQTDLMPSLEPPKRTGVRLGGLPTILVALPASLPREWMWGPTSRSYTDFLKTDGKSIRWLCGPKVLESRFINTSVTEVLDKGLVRQVKDQLSDKEGYLTGHYVVLDSTVTLMHNGFRVHISFDPTIVASLTAMFDKSTLAAQEAKKPNLVKFKGIIPKPR